MRLQGVVLLACVALHGCGSHPVSPSPSVPSSPTSSPSTPGGAPQPPAPGVGFPWTFSDRWQPAPDTRPPSCPSPLILRAPVNLSLATMILYPGQSRGGHYKAHGGIGFSQTNTVDVFAPMDGVVYRGARYTEAGEEQILIDIMNPCGVMYRFDHLRELSPRLQQIASQFPLSATDDTRTTWATPGQTVSAGELIAVRVGTRSAIGVDWGVYDLRTMNAASQNPAWLAQHGGEQAPYAVCWIDWLSASDAAQARSLPPPGTEGRTSDYCR